MADSLVKEKKTRLPPPKKRVFGSACGWRALIEKRKPLNKQFHPIYEHNSPCLRLKPGKTEILS